MADDGDGPKNECSSWAAALGFLRSAGPVGIVIGFGAVAGFTRALGLRPSELGFGIYEYLSIAGILIILLLALFAAGGLIGYWVRGLPRHQSEAFPIWAAMSSIALFVAAPLLAFELWRWWSVWIALAFSIYLGWDTRETVDDLTAEFTPSDDPFGFKASLLRMQGLYVAARVATIMTLPFLLPVCLVAAYFDGYKAAENIRDHGQTRVPVWLFAALTPEVVLVEAREGVAHELDGVCLIRLKADGQVLAGRGLVITVPPGSVATIREIHEPCSTSLDGIPSIEDSGSTPSP